VSGLVRRSARWLLLGAGLALRGCLLGDVQEDLLQGAAPQLDSVDAGACGDQGGDQPGDVIVVVCGHDDLAALD